jgi:hypothetical protein
MIGCYFESWACKDAKDLVNIDPRIDTIFLSFASPQCTYKKDQKTFQGTGLNFLCSFDGLKAAVSKHVLQGHLVMLSVGGAGTHFNTYNVQSIIALALDLGCTGIDIDWEPVEGVKVSSKFGKIISDFRVFPGKLSAAVFSTGAYGKQEGDTFKGLNIEGLVSDGAKLDFINLMAYDAGKNFDPCGAYDCYKLYYKGPILVGFEPGKQGWGDCIIDEKYCQRVCDYVPDIMFWAWYKDPKPSPSISKIIDLKITPSMKCVCGRSWYLK